MNKKISIEEILKKILKQDGASTQEEICHKLASMGIDMTQSSVSRWLRKINAVKICTKKGAGYVLSKSHSLPKGKLFLSIAHNSSMIVIRTVPGSASLFASMIDQEFSGQILGSLAGDDTIFVTPAEEQHIANVAKELENFLQIL